MIPRSHGSVRLGIAFAALGLSWGAQLACLLRLGCFRHDGPLWGALVLLVPVALAVIGVVVGQNRHRRVVPFVAVVIATLPSAGMLLGVLIGILWWPPDGILVGAHDGLLFGLAALPFLAPLLVAARTVGRARPGSLLDRVDGYGVWAAAGGSCALSSLATLPRWNTYPQCGVAGAEPLTQWGGFGLACGLLGLLVAIAMCVAQRVVTLQIRGARTSGLAGRRLPVLVDVGVGESRWEREATVPTAYRSIHSAELVVHGDPVLGYAAAARSAHGTVAIAIVSAVAVVVCLFFVGA